MTTAYMPTNSPSQTVYTRSTFQRKLQQAKQIISATPIDSLRQVLENRLAELPAAQRQVQVTIHSLPSTQNYIDKNIDSVCSGVTKEWRRDQTIRKQNNIKLSDINSYTVTLFFTRI